MNAPTPSSDTAARHEWIDNLCARLEKIIIGREATDLSTSLGDPGRGDVALLALPVWLWLPPRIDMGRKTVRRDGRTMLMPVRVTWSGSPVLVLHDGQSVELTWHMSGLGHSQRAQVTAHFVDGTVTFDGTLPGDEPVAVDVLTARALPAALDALVARGRAARWEALMSLEGYVEMAVRSAVSKVSADILAEEFDSTSTPVLDSTAQEQVRDILLLGSQESTDGGSVQRTLERCMNPGAFTKVDPLKYVVTDLYRSAETEVRRAVDDPYIGRKIRRVQREMPGASLEAVVAEYRVRHPGDDLSFKRARRALTSSRDVMSGVQDITDSGMSVGAAFDVEAIVLSRLERQRTAVSA